MFQGMFTALITPFSSGSAEAPSIDYKSLDSLVEWQLDCGIDGLVVLGTTAEAATLASKEKISIVERIKDIVKGQVPIIVGTGSNNTCETIEFTRSVKEIGVDGILLVSPYYNKPSQEGLFQHFSTVAKAGGLPTVLYNIPGRTCVTISPALFRRLAQIDNIVAVKQAVDSVSAFHEIYEAVNGKMDIFAGDDPLTYFVMTLGGAGVIAASGNVIPREMRAIITNAQAGDMKASLKAQQHVLPIIRALFAESNPAPVKAALKHMGQIAEDALRLPLVSVTPETRTLVAKALKEGGVHG